MLLTYPLSLVQKLRCLHLSLLIIWPNNIIYFVSNSHSDSMLSHVRFIPFSVSALISFLSSGFYCLSAGMRPDLSFKHWQILPHLAIPESISTFIGSVACKYHWMLRTFHFGAKLHQFWPPIIRLVLFILSAYFHYSGTYIELCTYVSEYVIIYPKHWKSDI